MWRRKYFFIPVQNVFYKNMYLQFHLVCMLLTIVVTTDTCLVKQVLSVFKALLQEKLKGAQCSELVKYRVSSIWFVQKKYDFLFTQEQKLGATWRC